MASYYLLDLSVLLGPLNAVLTALEENPFLPFVLTFVTSPLLSLNFL